MGQPPTEQYSITRDKDTLDINTGISAKRTQLNIEKRFRYFTGYVPFFDPLQDIVLLLWAKHFYWMPISDALTLKLFLHFCQSQVYKAHIQKIISYMTNFIVHYHDTMSKLASSLFAINYLQ